MCGICGVFRRYRFLLSVMVISFAAAGGVYAWNEGSRTVLEGLPYSALAAIPGLLAALYLICAMLVYVVLGFAARMLVSAPWGIRNIVTVSIVQCSVQVPVVQLGMTVCVCERNV
jgi:hypothetical protein